MGKFNKPLTCCKEASNLIYFLKKGDDGKKLTGKLNPEKTGYCISVDDIHWVNINFCPFCGKKPEHD